MGEDEQRERVDRQGEGGEHVEERIGESLASSAVEGEEAVGERDRRLRHERVARDRARERAEREAGHAG